MAWIERENEQANGTRQGRVKVGLVDHRGVGRRETDMKEFTLDTAKRLLNLKRVVCACFSETNWRELGMLTQCTEIIEGHPRLLRSLSWGDKDYESCVIEVLENLARKDKEKLDAAENYALEVAGGQTELVDAPAVLNKYVCTPRVFRMPEGETDRKLVALMMPFDAKFDAVAIAIKEAAASVGLNCQRVDDIWDDSTIIQDVFSLIYRSSIVVCDFSGRNANVFYEAGIAHTLGRLLIPLAQHDSDIPFDLRHHRYLMYLPNEQGLEELKGRLSDKFRQEIGRGQ